TESQSNKSLLRMGFSPGVRGFDRHGRPSRIRRMSGPTSLLSAEKGEGTPVRTDVEFARTSLGGHPGATTAGRFLHLFRHLVTLRLQGQSTPHGLQQTWSSEWDASWDRSDVALVWPAFATSATPSSWSDSSSSVIRPQLQDCLSGMG